VKIGVLGASGRLGSELVRQGCIPVYDRLESGTIIKSVKKFDCIINTAAYTDVDGCESDPVRAMNNNAIYLQTFVGYFRGKIVHISTDYIFDGKSGPYTESAEPKPIGIYGATKLLGENVIRDRNRDDLIVRTTVLFGAIGDNFANSVVAKLEKGKKISLPVNLIGNATYIPHLASAILYATRHNDYGIRNIAGRTILSRYHLGVAIAEKFGFDPELISMKLYDGPNNRPLMAGLVMGKNYPMMTTINEALDDYKAALKLFREGNL